MNNIILQMELSNRLEMNWMPRLIANMEASGYEVVAGEGHFLIYADGSAGRQCICFIYNPRCLPEHIDFLKPLHFIVLGNEIKLTGWGIPVEWISRYEFPLLDKMDAIPAKRGELRTGKMAYVLNSMADDPDGNVSLAVIKVFNCHLHLKCCCIVPESVIPGLQQVANENITFLPNTRNYTSLFAGCNVIIGAGAVVVAGLLSRLPVIVAGKYGFGGLVTADNFISFLSNRFSGRPGGVLGERTPPMFLAQELDYVLEVMNTNELDDMLTLVPEDLDRLRAFCRENTLSSIMGSVGAACEMGKLINCDTVIQQLKPKLSSSVVIDKAADGTFYVRNTDTNKVLAVMGDFEMRLIKACTGDDRIDKIIGGLGSEYDIPDCIRFLRSLWQLRAVCFVQETELQNHFQYAAV